MLEGEKNNYFKKTDTNIKFPNISGTDNIFYNNFYKKRLFWCSRAQKDMGNLLIYQWKETYYKAKHQYVKKENHNMPQNIW